MAQADAHAGCTPIDGRGHTLRQTRKPRNVGVPIRDDSKPFWRMYLIGRDIGTRYPKTRDTLATSSVGSVFLIPSVWSLPFQVVAAQEEEDGGVGAESIETQGMEALAQLPHHQQVRPSVLPRIVFSLSLSLSLSLAYSVHLAAAAVISPK